MNTNLTFDLLPVFGILISVFAWLIPGFRDWFEQKSGQYKQLFMAGVLLVIVLVTIALSALGFVSIYHGPTWREWVWYPLVDFAIALITNAGTYKATNYILGKKTEG